MLRVKQQRHFEYVVCNYLNFDLFEFPYLEYLFCIMLYIFIANFKFFSKLIIIDFEDFKYITYFLYVMCLRCVFIYLKKNNYNIVI